MNQTTLTSGNAWRAADPETMNAAQAIPAHWPNRESSRFVETEDATWHVQRSGHGPALLLLHGTGSSTHTWGEMLPLLAASHDVIAIDLPGHGFSSRLTNGSMSLQSIVAALTQLLAALHVAPLTSVGHSAGAAIALQLALREAATEQCVIGINAALRPYGGAFAGLFAPLAKSMVRVPFLPALVARRACSRGVVRRMLESTGSIPTENAVSFYQQLLTNEQHVAATLRMMADWDLRSLVDDIASIAPKCHLIVADRDRAVAPSQAYEVQRRYPEISVARLAGVGHLANEERPDLIVQHIARLAS